MLDRLTEQLQNAKIPIQGVSGTIGNAIICYTNEATIEQRAQGDYILAHFDWSEEAQEKWINEKERQKAVTNLSDKSYIYKLIRGLMLVMIDQLNELKDNRKEQITEDQIKTAIIDKIKNGFCDY